jgi:hypothetical protein
MARTRDCDHVVSQGTLRKGSARVDYYTTTPAPSQWIAVGVLFISSIHDGDDEQRSLIVGNGTTERQAIADLNNQFGETLADQRPVDSRAEGQSEDRPIDGERGRQDDPQGSYMPEENPMAEDDRPNVYH